MYVTWASYQICKIAVCACNGNAGVRRYFDPPIYWPRGQYIVHNDILTPLTIFWPPLHREHFPRHWLQMKTLVSDPGMHHGMCVTHVPWCMSGSLDLRWRGKRSRHSWRMRNPQFYVSRKRPMHSEHTQDNNNLIRDHISSGYWP